MRFLHLKQELKKWEKRNEKSIPDQDSDGLERTKHAEEPEPALPVALLNRGVDDRASERVVGGDILRKPIDKIAALVVSRAPWWAHPPVPEPTYEPKPKKPRERKGHMSVKKEQAAQMAGHGHMKPMPNQDYVSQAGVKVHVVNGEQLMEIDSVQELIIQQIEKMPRETRPSVHAAEDARRIVGELVRNLGADVEGFKVKTKLWLEEIRQTRFAVVRETAEMTAGLKDVRQFFLGSDYKDQIARLREFVDLCERLDVLKKSGFLDQVADTMLRLEASDHSK